MRLVSMPIVFMWMCVFVLSGCADMQLADNRDEPIEVVMSVAGKSNTQIFSAAKSWVAETNGA